METEHMLLCPLCLQQFHQPRLLDQCMHSFCNVCLCSYIRPLLSTDKIINKIPCPVCRTVLKGPNSSSELINWVEQLPSDPLLNMSHDCCAGNKQKNCEPCTVRGKRSNAQNFCKECMERLCKQCADMHMSFKGTRTHTLAKIDVHDRVEQDTEPLTMCEYHETKEVEYYCKDHDEMVCSKCAVLKHRVCAIVELDSHTTAESLSKLWSVDKIRPSFLKLKADIEDVDYTVQEGNERFQTQVHDALMDIEDKQKNVNAAIDKFKESIAMEIKQYLEQSKEVNRDNKRTATGIDNSLTLLKTAENKRAHIQVFLRTKAMKRHIESTRQRIKDCRTKCSSAHFEYSFSPNLTKIMKLSGLGIFSVRATDTNSADCLGTGNSSALGTDQAEYIQHDKRVQPAHKVSTLGLGNV